MSAKDRDERGWGRRLDGLIKRVGDEVGGERGEKVRARLTEAKSRVEAGLESDEARRIRGEMVTLGDKAMERVDDALRHEHTQAVVKRVDAALTEIGDRFRGEPTERQTSASPPGTDQTAAKTDEPAAEADQAAAAADQTAAKDDELQAGTDERAAEAAERSATADEAAAEAGEATAIRDAAPGAGEVSPAISTNGEDDTPAKRP